MTAVVKERQSPPPFCTNCGAHHNPDSRHHGWIRRLLKRRRKPT